MAWITAGDSPEELRKKYPEYGLYWKGARACAERFGYRIEEFSIDERMPLSRLDKILYSRNVKGLLLPPGNVMFHDWEKLHAGNYSIVRLSRSVQHIEAHLVTTNQTADGILASRKMHELGYRRVGFVGIKHKERLFYPGFAWGQQNQPHAELIPPLFLNMIAPEQQVEALGQWIHQHQPDAILEDLTGFYDLFDQAGFSVPGDIGIATQNALPNPDKAGIMQNLEEVGRVAMLMLISLIGDHDRGIPPISRQVLVKGQWVDGPTLPRVK